MGTEGCEECGVATPDSISGSRWRSVKKSRSSIAFRASSRYCEPIFAFPGVIRDSIGVIDPHPEIFPVENRSIAPSNLGRAAARVQGGEGS